MNLSDFVNLENFSNCLKFVHRTSNQFLVFPNHRVCSHKRVTLHCSSFPLLHNISLNSLFLNFDNFYNLVLSTGLIMWIGHRKEIRKLTFRALSFRRSQSRGTLKCTTWWHFPCVASWLFRISWCSLTKCLSSRGKLTVVFVCHRTVSMAAVYQLKINYNQDKFGVVF